jgi:hypothetical protein
MPNTAIVVLLAIDEFVHASSLVVDDAPKCGFFLLPFFGGALLGMFSLAFIGVPRPPDGR